MHFKTPSRSLSVIHCLVLSALLLPVTVWAWPYTGISQLFDLRPRYIDTHFVGESNLFELEGEVDWGTIIYPNETTNVLVRPNTVFSPFRGAVIDPMTSGVAYVTFALDMTSSGSCKSPPFENAWPTIWRIDVDETNPGWPGLIVLDEDTMVRGYLLEGDWTGYSMAWDISSWPAARYSWFARDASGELLAEGDFRLGVLTWQAGMQSGVPNILLVHGLASSGEMWNNLPSEFLPHFNVFTLDYPNAGSIPLNAELLGLALEDLNEAHVVAHSMGGVITRYYKQMRGGAGLKRVVSLGAPYEGSPYAMSSQTLMAYSTLASCLFDNTAGDLAGVWGSKAMSQLADPVGLFGLYGNAHPWVADDSSLLTMCGTRWGLGLPIDMFNSLMQIASGRRLIRDVTELMGNSDGVVTWESALKAPIAHRKNIYLSAGHTTYTNPDKNEDYDKMVNAIHAFLRFGSANLEARPLLPQERLALRAVSGAQAIQNAFLIAWNGISDSVRILSPPSGSHGLIASSVLNLEEGENHYVWAPGYEPASISVSSSPGPMAFTVTSHDTRITLDTDNQLYIVDLNASSDYVGPRNANIVINEGELTTTSATVQLSLSCENATEMSIVEPGGEAAWEPYGGGVVQRSFTFGDSSPGLKEVEVSFRDSEGRLSPVASDSIILASEAATGSLAVSDAVGGAFIVLDGQLTEYQTPETIGGLAPGEYIVDVVRAGTRYGTPSAQSVQISADQTASVYFDAFTSHGVPVSWLIQQGVAPNDVGAEGTAAGNFKYWEHYIAGTDPNDPTGYLAVVQVAPEGSGEAIRLEWRSVANRTYEVHRSTNLKDGFTPLALNIPGQDGSTVFIDSTVSLSGVYIYRVEVLRE